ncbi:MAG TPA: ATP-binding protein, partial [Longimicrobiales bacterium]|nr:ATP-binding protein [Longimicrobiales bacterium]
AVHPDDRERVTASWAEAVRAGRSWSAIYRFLHPDGRVVWVSGRAAPMRVEGEMAGFVGTLEDITELKEVETAMGEAAADREQILERERLARAEAERRARKEQALREAAAAVSASSTTAEVVHRIATSAIQATDADGAIIERIDIPPTEIIVEAAVGRGEGATGIRLPYEGSLAKQVVETARHLSIDRLSKVRHRLPDDVARLHPDDAALVLPLVDAGEPIGGLILLRDREKGRFGEDEVRHARTFASLASLAFRRIHLLEDSERRREELERVMESRARLMRGFSHDVKNPLGAADGILSLLEEGVAGKLSTEQRRHLTRARRAIARSLQIIEDLLELARAEADTFEVRWGPVDVRDVVRELAEEYRVQAEGKGLDFQVDLPGTTPVIESDAGRVRQILGNLISNAIKYTDEGTVRIKVSRRPEFEGRAGDWVATEIVDTGVGISAKTQHLLFQEFTRLSPEGRKGTGLGLAISQRMAGAMGGRITATSRAGAGSVFTLWLPCERDVADE